MKVLILATDFYTRGGIARFTSTLASSLGRLVGAGQVEVLALLDIGNPSDLDLDCKVLAAISSAPTLYSKVAYAAKALELGRRRYDLVICSHVSLSPIARAVRAMFGAPYWIVCHGSEVWAPLPAAVRGAMIAADRLLAVSSFTAERAILGQRVPRANVSVLHNAIPDGFENLLAESRGESAAGDPTVLSVGNLSRTFAYKGFDTLIEVLPALRSAVPSVRYVFVGDGDDVPRLKELAARKNVSECLLFLGSISDAELARQYNRCTVFALPSRAKQEPGECCGEGFGRVYVEASMAGKPVLGSSAGGAAEAVIDGRTGLVVDPDSPAEIGSALLTLLTNPPLAEAMGREGRRWASEQFSIQAQMRALRSLLNSTVLSGTRGLQLV